MQNLLIRRNFFCKSFEIYPDNAGFWDLGPPGSLIMNNIVNVWKSVFVIPDPSCHLFDCAKVTPEQVLKSSGHVSRFTDIVLRDQSDNSIYRADHFVRDWVIETISKNSEQTSKSLNSLDIKYLQEIIPRLETFDPSDFDSIIEKYSIPAPGKKFKNTQWLPAAPLNVMFKTSYGDNKTAYLRPETAQGLFTNFHHISVLNNGKLPFSGAQIGTAWRNEIAPKGILRTREFLMAEIEQFYDPDESSESVFEFQSFQSFQKTIIDTNIPLFTAQQQITDTEDHITSDNSSCRFITPQRAYDQGIISNARLAISLGKTFHFLTLIGIDPEKIRFRQHLKGELSHYASDCWDAEVYLSDNIGWTEVAGHADRGKYDLKAHSLSSNKQFEIDVALETPQEVNECFVSPISSQIGPLFKSNAKKITQALSKIDPNNLTYDTNDNTSLHIKIDQEDFVVPPSCFEIINKTTLQHSKKVVPHVVEPSFGLSRIFYSLLDSSYYVRKESNNNELERGVFRFSPYIAPFYYAILTLASNKQLKEIAERLYYSLTSVMVTVTPSTVQSNSICPKSVYIDTTSAGIGKKYAKADELGIPYAITIDSETLSDGNVTIRNRDDMTQTRVPISSIQ